jgi:hypothetical protein
MQTVTNIVHALQCYFSFQIVCVSLCLRKAELS